MNAGFAFPVSQTYLWVGATIAGVVLLAMALRVLERRRSVRLETFVEHQLAPRLLAGVNARLRRPLYWLTLTGAAALALTLMQPHWGQSYERVSKRSHDVLVCLDVSESMLAEAPAPNRLERARQKIAALMDRAFGDRFGLIAFSGAAELMCPLTLDHAYFRTVLAAVDTDSISLEGTDISAAFEVAAAAFQDQAADGEDAGRDNRAVVLISDGEAVAGDAVAAAEELGKLAHVFVIGVGDPRGTNVTYVNRFVRGDVQEQTHLSRLDERTLQKIALAGGGGYIRSTPNNRDVEEIFGLVQQLFARDVDSDVEQRLVNRYQWPLAVAIACFFTEGVWLVLMPVVTRRRESRRKPGGGEVEYA